MLGTVYAWHWVYCLVLLKINLPKILYFPSTVISASLDTSGKLSTLAQYGFVLVHKHYCVNLFSTLYTSMPPPPPAPAVCLYISERVLLQLMCVPPILLTVHMYLTWKPLNLGRKYMYIWQIQNIIRHILTCMYCVLFVIFPIGVSRCNPFCEVVVDGQKGNIKTDVQKKTTAPNWDEEFTLWVHSHNTSLYWHFKHLMLTSVIIQLYNLQYIVHVHCMILSICPTI